MVKQRKSNWRKIDSDGVLESLHEAKEVEKAAFLDLNNVFKLDSSASLSKNTSQAIRKSIQRKIQAPIIQGKSKEHVKLLEKIEKRLSAIKSSNKPNPKQSRPLIDIWGDQIEIQEVEADAMEHKTESERHLDAKSLYRNKKARLEKAGIRTNIAKPESILNQHIPSVPLPTSGEAFNPSIDSQLSLLEKEANKELQKIQEEKDLAYMHQPMTNHLCTILKSSEVRLLDSITRQRVFKATCYNIEAPLIRAAIQRYRILHDESMLLSIASGIVPDNLRPYEGFITDGIDAEKSSFMAIIKKDELKEEEGLLADTIDVADDDESPSHLIESLEGDSSDEDEEDQEEEGKLNQSYIDRKTQAQRNKEKKHRELLQTHIDNKKIKKGLAMSAQEALKEVLQEEKRLNETKRIRKLATEARIEREKVTGHLECVKRVGKNKFSEPHKNVVLPSEMIESEGKLRKLSLKYNTTSNYAIVERFASILRKNRIEHVKDNRETLYLKKQKENEYHVTKGRKNVRVENFEI